MHKVLSLMMAPTLSVSAVHRVLVVDELVTFILDWVVEMDGIASIAPLARVHSVLFEPTIRRVWAVLRGVGNILKVASAPLHQPVKGAALDISLLKSFRSTSNMINVHRIRLYLGFVREVWVEDNEVDALSRTFSLLNSVSWASGCNPALPHVHTLDFKSLSTNNLYRYGPNIVAPLEEFCGPDLIRVHFPRIVLGTHGASDFSVVDERVVTDLTASPSIVRTLLSNSIFHALAKRQQKLESLTLAIHDERSDGEVGLTPDIFYGGVDSDGTVYSVGQSLKFLREFTVLRSLSLSIPLFPGLLCELGHLPLLEDLELTITPGQTEASALLNSSMNAAAEASMGSRPFAALQTLRITVTASWAWKRTITEVLSPIFVSAGCYAQRELVLTVGFQLFRFTASRDIRALLALFIHPSHSTDLRTFRLLADMDHQDCSVDVHVRDLIPALRACRNLLTIQVDGCNLLVHVRDEDLLALGRVCRGLETVRLGAPVTADNSEGSFICDMDMTVSASSVVAFAFGCIQLRELQVLLHPEASFQLLGMRMVEGVPERWLHTLLSARDERLKELSRLNIKSNW